MRLFFFLFLLLSVWFAPPLQARELSSYRLGDVAESDIIAPAALNVVDVAATAELKATRARQFPSIFRSFPGATNQMAQDFLTAFAEARVAFLNDLTNEYHAQTLSDTNINSPDFGRLVTAFGVAHKNFPITDELAAEWAKGKDGAAIRQELLTVMQWAAGRLVRPDAVPDDMVVGDAVRLVSVTDPDQKISFAAAQQGPVVAATNLMTLSSVQALFRREFPAPQQLFARALSTLIRPNCWPDAPLTQLTRGTAVYQMVVSDHFDVGDVIVHRGEPITAKILAAIKEVEGLPKSVPLAIAPTSATSPPPTQTTSPVPAAPRIAQAPAPRHVVPEKAATPTLAPAPRSFPHLGLILTLASISVAALLVAVWQFLQRPKSAPKPGPPGQTPLPLAGDVKTDLTPQVTQAVREAVQQELASQRRELLVAQQAAADEIAALVQRLDELQVPMQQRLQTYENRIQMLEKELTLRNEENRELLKVKIEMMSRQLEAERGTMTTTITGS